MRPAWCGDWFRALDARLEPFGDRSVPEWRTVGFLVNLQACAVRLPPAWCPEWLADVRAAEEHPRTAAAMEELRAHFAAVEEEGRRLAAERDAYMRPFLEAAARVREGRQTLEDVALVEGRAEIGEQPAVELLAWMHVVGGRGVPRSFGRAYALYGRLVLDGREDLRPNLDSLWPRLTREDQQAMFELFGGPGRAAPAGRPGG